MTLDEYKSAHPKATKSVYLGSVYVEGQLGTLINDLRKIEEMSTKAPEGYLSNGRLVCLDDYDNNLEVEQVFIESDWAYEKRMAQEWAAEKDRQKLLEQAREDHIKAQEDKIVQQELFTLKMLAKKYGKEIR